MALTILQSPSGEPSVQDSLWHVVTSDNSGQVDFKYVFDVWANGVQLIREKHFADPETGQGYFDAGAIVRNGFSYEWFTPVNSSDHVYLNQPSTSGEIALSYQVRYGEDVSGVSTFNMASGETRAYNWVPPLFGRRTYDSSIKLNKFLTNRPSCARIPLGQKLLIPFKTSNLVNLDLKMDTYDHANNLINSYADANFYENNGYIQLDIGSVALNDRFGSEYINEGVKYYDVFFDDFEKFRVYHICNPKYQPINLYFLNHWGMFDTAHFGLVSKLSKEIERKSFEKREFRTGPGSVTYMDANNVYHETKINHLNKNSFSYRLTMDAPTDAEWQWLAELMDSPQIYMEMEGHYYPVTIKNTSYEYSQYVFNRLKPFEIDIELNQTRYSALR